MRHTAVRTTLLATIVGVALPFLVSWTAPATADPATQGGPWGRYAPYSAPAPPPGSAKGAVTGEIEAPGSPRLKVLWFTADWSYLGERAVGRGIYNLNLPAGRYRLQFVDTRPAYDLRKLAPSDVSVTVREGRTTQKDVRMRVGAGVTGTVRAGGRAAGGATVVAAGVGGQSFPVKADGRGRFALGGLPAGTYSLFTYDRARRWVDRSVLVRGLRLGQTQDVAVRLRKRAGELRVQLYTGDGEQMRDAVSLTAVSVATGQFWTARSHGGAVIFRGLYAGRYRLVAPGVDGYLPRTGRVEGGRVRFGHADLASRFTWTARGASISGTVLDGVYPDVPLDGALVVGYDRSGRELDRSLTGADGRFTLGGSLTTQDGMVVEVRPSPDNPPYMQGAFYCKFDEARLTGVAVTTGSDTTLGAVSLPQLPTSQQDNRSNCGPDHTAPRGP